LSPQFNPKIQKAIFHYAAHSEAGECFQVCISTEDVDTAVWKYAYASQLVPDSTFGICTSCLLLFIALAQDEEKKGVPINLFLFSASTGNCATHVGYNTAILCELLLCWEVHLSSGFDKLFAPYIAITDMDAKDCGALLDIWPNIQYVSLSADFICGSAGLTIGSQPYILEVQISGKIKYKVPWQVSKLSKS